MARAATALLLLLLSAPAGAEDSCRDLLIAASDLAQPPRIRNSIGRQILARGEAGATALIAGLRHERSVVRQTAALLLVGLEDLRAEDALLETAAGPDPLAGGHALRTLSRLYARLLPDPALGERLAAPSPKRDAALAAVSLRPRASAPAAAWFAPTRAALEDPAPGVRRLAVDALSRFAGPEAGTALLSRLPAETDAETRIALCRALGALRPAGAAEALAPLLKSADPATVLAAAVALHHLGAPSGQSILPLLGHAAPEIRRAAALALGELRDPFALEDLAKATADPIPEVRLAALDAVACLPGAGVGEVLRARLKDEDPRVRARAAVLLDRSGLAGAAWPLLEDLRSADIGLRLASARALGEFKPPTGRTELERALEDAELEVACAAAESLAARGETASLPALARALAADRPGLADAVRDAATRISGEDPGQDAASRKRWAEARKLPWTGGSR